MVEKLALLYGNDELSLSEAASVLLRKWCPGNQQTSLEIFDGQVETIDLADELLAKTIGVLKEVDLFSDQKTVFVKHALFLGTTGPGKSDKIKERLKELVACIENGLSGSNRLLLTTPQIDKRGAFFKYCKKLNVVDEHILPEKTWQAEKHAREFAATLFKKKNLQAPSHILDAFMDKVGVDLRQIKQEVEKISLYLSSTSPDWNQALSIVSPTREAIAWDLADAVSEGRTNDALEYLRQLMAQKESAVGLIIQLNRRFRELQIIRECLDEDWLRLQGQGRYQKAAWSNTPEMEERLSELGDSDPRKIHVFRLMRLTQQAQRFSATVLKQRRQLISQTHEQLTSCPIPAETLLSLLFLRMRGLQQQ